MVKCHLVSFADGARFPARRPVFTAEAIANGYFASVTVHTLDTLPEQFRENHERWIRANPRGFGYWIWKPVAVQHALSRAGTGDVVLYLDAGYTLNPRGARRFREYVEMTLDHVDRTLSFSNVYTEAHWSKADLAYRLGLGPTDSHLRTSQLGGGMFFLAPTASNIDLVRTWSEIAVERDYHFSDDSPSDEANHPDFVEHRHDQSIFSLLRKMRGTATTHFEVQAYAAAFEKYKHTVPAWATRIRH